MTSRRRRSNGSASKNAAGIFLMGVAGTVIAAALVGFFVVNQRKPHIDPETLCAEAGPGALTVILVDATDPISPLQRASIENQFAKLQSSIARGERIDIYEIRDAEAVLQPRLGLCRPQSAAEVNEMTGNKSIAQRRFDERFRTPFDEVVDAMLERPEGATSPIMEAVQGATVASLSKWTTAQSKRLVVISDMLENGAGGVHYRGAPTMEAFKRDAAYDRVRANLKGVSVEIWYLRRDAGAPVQGRAHIEFWSDYFADQGASLDRVVQIEGVN